MIDAGAVVRSVLADDPVIAGEATGVYLDTVPAGAVAPFVVVRVLTTTYAAPPTTAWDMAEVQVDVVGDEPAEAAALAGAVRDLLQDTRGTVGTTSVAAVDVVNTTYLLDTTSSPARPRWVVAVEVTAQAL